MALITLRRGSQQPDWFIFWFVCSAICHVQWHIEQVTLMEILGGFKRVREQALPELNSTARFYRHAKTGAELLSLVNDDDNKVFRVTFRTPPRDLTGVARFPYRPY